MFTHVTRVLFNYHCNVFRMFKFYICKSHFHISSIKGKTTQRMFDDRINVCIASNKID